MKNTIAGQRASQKIITKPAATRTAAKKTPAKVEPQKIPPKGQGKVPKDRDLKLRIAQRLRAAREAYSESSAAMARKLGVTTQVLHAAETGRNYPDALMLIRFCLITGCTMDWIFLGRMESRLPVTRAARIGALHPELVGDAEEVERVLERASAAV